jgi:hypothetical protein
MQKKNDFSDINAKDIENSLNSALINNMNNNIEKDKNSIAFYKYLSYFSMTLLFLLLCIIIIFLAIKG